MTQQKILVVDDDQRLLRLVELSLRRAGYQAITAITGELGVEKVRTEQPDLVLMDVMMPGIDGFEATKRIRRLSEGRHIPIIFLSALGEKDAKIKGLRIGGDDYVTKPVSMGELLARIEARLRRVAPVLGRLIIVLGSRAGVGTTTLTINLALALRRIAQNNVLLVDWQRPLGDVALYLNLPRERILESLLPHIHNLDEQAFTTALKEYLPGVWVLPGATDPASAGQMSRETLSNVLEIVLTKADYVLVDGGSFFSWEDPPLIAKEEGINLCVLTPELTSIERAASAMGTVNVMNYHFWPLLNRDSMLGGIPRKQIESRLGIPLEGCVPDESDQMSRSLDEGRPLYVIDPDSDFSRAIHDIATQTHGALAL
jgi:DNA-binding response OmpR family regulator